MSLLRFSRANCSKSDKQSILKCKWFVVKIHTKVEAKKISTINTPFAAGNYIPSFAWRNRMNTVLELYLPWLCFSVHVKMDNAAETYDRIQGSYQGKNGLELIDKLALRRGSVVLDLGCGTGYLSSVLAERV